jgi:hypothetical protein
LNIGGNRKPNGLGTKGRALTIGDLEKIDLGKNKIPHKGINKAKTSVLNVYGVNLEEEIKETDEVEDHDSFDRRFDGAGAVEKLGVPGNSTTKDGSRTTGDKNVDGTGEKVNGSAKGSGGDVRVGKPKETSLFGDSGVIKPKKPKVRIDKSLGEEKNRSQVKKRGSENESPENGAPQPTQAPKKKDFIKVRKIKRRDMTNPNAKEFMKLLEQSTSTIDMGNDCDRPIDEPEDFDMDVKDGNPILHGLLDNLDLDNISQEFMAEQIEFSPIQKQKKFYLHSANTPDIFS